MHTVAKAARSKVKNWAEKWAVDEATRKLALRIAKIKKVQPSYTSGRRKIREIESAEDQGNSGFPGACRDIQQGSI